MVQQHKEVYLLRKGHSGLKQLLLGRMTIALILLIGQLLVLLAVFAWFEEYCLHYLGGNTLIAIFMILYIFRKNMDPAARSSWLILIMAAPIFGTMLYLFTSLELGHRLFKRRVRRSLDDSKGLISQDPKILKELYEKDKGAAALCRFLNQCDWQVFDHTSVKYFSFGEEMMQQLLCELEKAEKCIFMEYFIIGEGVFWGSILDILLRKAEQGVDVRILYDGTSEFMLLPKGYAQKMEKMSIRCKVFAPVLPIVSTHYNYRDHRKIAVIDGHTAFTGGINLSDEYINIGCKFGHWKDTAVMLQGPAAKGFHKMFQQMWNIDEKEADFTALKTEKADADASGYTVAFGDNPLDQVPTGQTVYMDMINRAVDSVYIVTPYLILDDEMENCLCYAALRGVDVQLILPGIPDKYVPYALAKTHYQRLTNAGIKIYEYSPGFVHAKMVVTDQREAVVGTINFDYRSFRHHFECGLYMYKVSCIRDIISDILGMISQSRRVTAETIKADKWHRKLIGFLLKPFSPLL